MSRDISKRPLGIAFLAGCSLLLCAIRPLSAQPCIGDCKGQGRVEIADLIVAVRIVLGLAPPDACANLGAPPIGIATLVTAVNNALCACQPCATRPPVPTFTPTALPSETPTRGPDGETVQACEDDCQVGLQVCGEDVFFYDYASVDECVDECVGLVLDYAAEAPSYDGCVTAQVDYIQCCSARRQCGGIPGGCTSLFVGAANSCGGQFGGCPLIFFDPDIEE